MPNNPKSPSDSNYLFDIKNTRPEEEYQSPLEFYDDDEVKKYAESKSMMRTQEKITKRVLKIAEVPAPARVLDIGTGCGFSSMFLYIQNYEPVGIDIHWKFLNYYRDLKTNPINSDMRQFHFRKNSFDLIISISAVQWIFSIGDASLIKKHLETLAHSCAECLKTGGKIVIQFYPKTDEDMHKLGHAFHKLGIFEGGFQIDNVDNPPKRKIYLTLTKVKDRQ